MYFLVYLVAQTNNRETQAEGIGWELFRNYLIAKEKWNPDYFLYENNKSAAEPIKAQIRKELGVHEKIQDDEQLEGQLSLFDEDFDNGVRFTYINSALVSAQNRQRFYVTNFGDIEQPKDRGILLKDVLDNSIALQDKSHACISSCGITTEREYFKKNQGNMVAERVPKYGQEDKSRPVEATYSRHAGCGEGSLEHRMFSDNPSKQQVDLVAEQIKPLTEKEMDYMVRDHQDQRRSFCNKPNEECKSKCLVANVYKGVPYNVVAEPIAEPVCVAMRGRSPDNPSDRTAGIELEQIFEARTDGKTNTLTTVEKDNRVAEPIQVGSMPRPNGELSTSQAFRVYDTEAKSVTLKAQGGGAGGKTGLYAMPFARSIPNLNVPEATSKGYAVIECGDCVDMQHLGSKNRRGRSMKDKSNAMQTSNDFYQYMGYVIEFDESGKPVKAIGKNGKEITIYEVKDGQITIKGKQYPIKLFDGYYIIRKLTVNECKRLQTVPDWYEFPVSDSRAYQQLGNGWTVEVIKHLLSHIPHIQEEEIEVLSMYDGMSCGQIALKELGCNVVKYTAYEIDKYAIQTTQHNFPNTIQKGDAFAVRDEDWSI